MSDRQTDRPIAMNMHPIKRFITVCIANLASKNNDIGAQVLS